MSKRKVPSRRRKSAGFTLIELLVATILSSIILMGMFSILTNMVSAEVNGMRNGTVTAWSLAGISTMNTDIAGAGAIGYPPAGAVGDDSLIVCTNWSTRTAPPAAVVTGNGNDVFYYCWDTTDAAPFGNALLRRRVNHAGGSEACPTAAIACNQATYSAGGGFYGTDTIVATGVYKDGAADHIFVQDANTANAVRLRYTVGNAAANAVSAGSNGGTVNAVPVSVPFNTEIILED